MRVGTLEIQIMAALARLQKDMNDAQRMVGGAMGNVERSVASAKRAMQTLGVGLPIVAITDQVRRMSDQYTKLDAQIRLATKSQAAYAQGMADIRRISSVAQADISATSMLYTRLMNVMDGTGVSQQKLATVTETISFGLKAYGATTQEAASAALQLSQAMGANRLGGEEFRAVMEAMPNVMKVLADSMGVPLGELRALSIAGKITAEEMVKAFGNPAIAAQMKALAMSTQTVTGAWQVARNELMLLVGEFAKSSGLTQSTIAAFSAFGAVFRVMADNMDLLMRALGAYTAVLVGKFVVGVVEARLAQMALNAAHVEALATNVAMAKSEASLAAAKAGTAASTAATTVSLLRNTLATVEARTATLANVVAENEATIAQLNHAKAAGMLSGHYYMVRKVEAELVVVTQALTAATTELNAATARQARLEAALVFEDKALTKARGELALATAAVTRAEKLQEASSIGIMGRVKGLMGKAGWIGLALFGAWTVYDFLDGMQQVADGADKLKNKFEGMTLAEVQMARQRELIRQIGMRGMFQDDAAIQNSQDMIRAYDQQIAKMVELQNAETAAQRVKTVTATLAHDDQVIIERYNELLKQYNDRKLTQAEFEARVHDLYGVGAKALKAYAKEQKTLEKIEADRLANMQEYMKGIGDETQALLDKAAAEEADLARMGLTAEQLSALTQTRYDEQIALKAAEVARLRGITGREAEIALIEQQIAALNRLKKADSAQVRKAADLKALEEQKRAHKDFWDSIDHTAHDTFVSIMDGGKDAATRLKDAFKNIFYDWLYQMTLKKWIVNMSGVVSTSGTGSAMGGLTGGGVGSWLSAGQSLWSAFSGGMASSFGSLAISAGEMFGSAALGEFGVGALYSAGGGSIAGAFAGGTASGLGAAVGAALPWVAGALALGSLFGGGGGLFGGNGPKGVPLGDVDKSFSPTGQVTRAQSYFGGSSASSEAIVNNMQLAYMQAAAALGISTAATQFSYAGNTRGYVGSGGPAFALSGGAGLTRYSTYQETSEAAVQLAASRAVFAALKGSQLPGYLRTLFDELTPAAMTKEQIDNTLAFAQALKQTRDALTETRAPIDIFRQNVADGMRVLGTSAATFKTDFVRAIDAGLTPETLTMWQQLGAAMEQLNAVEVQLAAEAAQAAAAVLQERLGLEKQLLQLQGNTTELRKRELAAMDATNRPLQKQIWAMQDKAAADERAARAAQDLTAAWQSAADLIFEESARIRGLTATPSGSMAQFSTLTAMARAGDQEAAKLLPGVARAVLDTAALTASNATDLARIQGRTAASLETTGSSLASKYGLTIPAFAAGGSHTGGLRMVGENGPELEYTGPSTVFSNRDTRKMLDNSGVIASVDALRDELRAIGIAVSGSTQKTAKILDRWDGQGMPEVREAA